uniref:Uncharacterized protein n=1 Tax=Romanomermis culicivorax TaxID=13658 RepID=A0A915I3Y9_ROMCU
MAGVYPRLPGCGSWEIQYGTAADANPARLLREPSCLQYLAKELSDWHASPIENGFIAQNLVETNIASSILTAKVHRTLFDGKAQLKIMCWIVCSLCSFVLNMLQQMSIIINKLLCHRNWP